MDGPFISAKYSFFILFSEYRICGHWCRCHSSFVSVWSYITNVLPTQGYYGLLIPFFFNYLSSYSFSYITLIFLKQKRDRLIRIARERLLCSAGDPDRINPEISVEEQVDLLPYDLKWEFPRNRIILGYY